MITVYVLQSTEHRKRYVGLTNNMARREKEHRSRSSKAGQLLGDFRIVYTESFPDYESARIREKFLKSGRGRAWLDSTVTRSWPA